ncbi:MAG: TetR/AcrR family transcriptional regulator [Acidimicrobiales bacterium]
MPEAYAVDRATDQEAPGRTRHARGRPRIRQDAEILDAALKAFASQGYEAMSLRSLNAGLGLSHGTISQRFGTKERLYLAAVDRGFAVLMEDIDSRRRHFLDVIDPADDLADLRATIRSFLGAAQLRPELGRLMNQEGPRATVRLRHLVESAVEPMMETIGAIFLRLRADGRIRPVSARGLFFLVTQGAESPYTLSALSGAFDPFDGPLDPERHADEMTDVIMRGIAVDVVGQDGATSALRARAGPQPLIAPRLRD